MSTGVKQGANVAQSLFLVVLCRQKTHIKVFTPIRKIHFTMKWQNKRSDSNVTEVSIVQCRIAFENFRENHCILISFREICQEQELRLKIPKERENNNKNHLKINKQEISLDVISHFIHEPLCTRNGAGRSQLSSYHSQLWKCLRGRKFILIDKSAYQHFDGALTHSARKSLLSNFASLSRVIYWPQ